MDDITGIRSDQLVSVSHAVIQKIKDDYYLKDLSSTNGTFVNDVRLPKDKYIKLREGDVVRLGRVEVSFVLVAT